MREPFLLETHQTIERPLRDVFAFFAAPENLEAITPPWLNFRILTPSPIQMKPGAIIDYKIRLRGIPIRWRTRITDYAPPHRFIDTQIRGPYLLWKHTHIFEALPAPSGREATRITDRVRYIPRDFPAWLPLLGGTLHRRFVRPELERIFAYRTKEIARRLALAHDTGFTPSAAS